MSREGRAFRRFLRGLIYGGLAAALPVAIQALSVPGTLPDWRLVASAFATGVLLGLDKWVRTRPADEGNVN